MCKCGVETLISFVIRGRDDRKWVMMLLCQLDSIKFISSIFSINSI